MQHRLRFLAPLLLVLALGCAHTNGSSPDGSAPAEGSYGDDAAAGDERAYTERYLAEIRRRNPDAGCVYGGLRTLRCGDAEISLDRVWAFCIQNVSECDATVLDFAGGMSDALRQQEVMATSTREQLRVAIRPTSYLAQVRDRVEGAVIRPVAGDLGAIVMVDWPTTARAFGETDTTALGLDADGAFALGLANTLAELQPITADSLPACGSIAGVQNDYFYESTRLLDPSLRALAGAQRVLVAVPAYDVFLLTRECDSPTATAISLAAIATQVATTSETPLATSVFRLGPNGPELVMD